MMRKRCLTGLVLICCCAAACLYGQSAKRSGRRSGAGDKSGLPSVFVPSNQISVDMSLQRPPVYSVENRKVKVGGNVPDSARQWLVNEIAFSCSYRQTKNTRPIVLEEVKVELYIYAADPARSGSAVRWWCGVQTLQCLVIDPDLRARRYWASLFLPPAYVYLYFPLDRTGKYNLRGLEGVVVISDRDNNLLGWRAFGYKNKLSASRAKKLYAAAMELRSRKSSSYIMLWPREKTPWEWIDADRFELPSTPISVPPQGGDGKPVPPAVQEGNEE